MSEVEINRPVIPGMVEAAEKEQREQRENGVKILNWDQIRQAKDITIENHFVLEWNGWVELISITQDQMNKAEDMAKGEDGRIVGREFQKLILISGMHDPAPSEDDVAMMMQKSAAAVTGIVNKILDISHLTEESVKKAEAKFPEE